MQQSEEQQVDDGWVVLQKGRAYVLQKFPWFYPTLLGLVPNYSPGLKTLGVTPGLVLDIDFVWFSTLSDAIAGGCLIHECMHVLRDLDRLYALPNLELANLAFDLPINDDLKTAGVELPSWAKYTSTFNLPPGLTGEAYYDLLSKMSSTAPDGGLRINGKDVDGGVCSGKCGGCAGTPNKNEDDRDKDFGRSPADVEYFKRAGINAIKEAMASGKLGGGRGNTAGFFSELLQFDGREKPVVPWKEMAVNSLRRANGRMKCGQTDYSIRKPSKRTYTQGILRPGMITHEVSIAYIEDSSGSMGPEQLKAGRIEMGEAMVRLSVTNVWFLCADTQVQSEPRKIRARDLKTLPVLGRGGTSFVAAIDAVMKLRPRPHIIIYATDGDGTAPEHKPKGVEFIWLLVPGPWTVRPCDWGTQILMSDLKIDRERYGFD